MLRFLFVRHGRTPWNVQGRVQGGGGLDEVGRAQAAALGERLSSEPITAIYASPALRARQTATAVASRHGLKVRQRSLLRDMDYGKIAGALLSDVEARDPDLVERWRARPDTVRSYTIPVALSGSNTTSTGLPPITSFTTGISFNTLNG